jgi:hypothetical protein
MSTQTIEVTAEGFTATITRSMGADGAVVIHIDGPDDGPSCARDTMPDGQPRCRILLNDEPVYQAVAFDPDPGD